ncbi:LOG family protein [Acaryochloris sp. IP29b_bin.137]|uniref:LOG family protein n=1 Tax=Acaryochloris sp. IP29b_bin.137 TaxID=2969217 RepID=UPI00263454BE|nr:LOG family protein [Acaryochloris sp. IP29b_bin.137]
MTQPFGPLGDLNSRLQHFVEVLPKLTHGPLIRQAIETLLNMAEEDLDRLDWKILSAALQDLEEGFQVFHRYRHVRKISIFGSSRLPPESPAYQMAVDFARCVTQKGFMVMTGAGGGIMEAGNKGAGAEQSFGLNIQLPFEQSSNPYIAGDEKLIDFKYFFTRKLFFLRETDAIALFPGGFGTQDEAFECLTLSQTGKSPPVPVVLIDPPGTSYWQDWDTYIHEHLIAGGLISAEDHQLYTITDNLETACAAILEFYQVYHSSRYVGDQLVMRLNQELTDVEVEWLNQSFADILTHDLIRKSNALPEELDHQEPQPQQVQDETEHLPRLVFHFNQRDHGRLNQMITAINRMGDSQLSRYHPERK